MRWLPNSQSVSVSSTGLLSAEGALTLSCWFSLTLTSCSFLSHASLAYPECASRSGSLINCLPVHRDKLLRRRGIDALGEGNKRLHVLAILLPKAVQLLFRLPLRVVDVFRNKSSGMTALLHR